MKLGSRLVNPLWLACLVPLCALPAAADDGFEFGALLTGAQEVPDNGSEGSARATVRFDKGFTQLDVRIAIDLESLTGTLTRAHFHCAPAGANGPIPIGLIDPGDLVLDGNQIRGTLTNDDFAATDPCPAAIDLPVNNLAALAFAMRQGLIYLNIHTDVFPAGEIRGQLSSGRSAAGSRSEGGRGDD